MYKTIVNFSIMIFVFSIVSCFHYNSCLNDVLNKNGVNYSTKIEVYENKLLTNSLAVEKAKDIIFDSDYASEIVGPIKSFKKYKIYFIINNIKIDSLLLYNDEVILYKKKYYKFKPKQ